MLRRAASRGDFLKTEWEMEPMRPEWEGRLNNWHATLEREFYEPLGELALEGFCTYDMRDPAEAERHAFAPMPVGTAWGRTWEY